MGDFAASDEDLEFAIDEGAVRAHMTTLFSGSDDAYRVYTPDAVLTLPQSGQTLVGRDSIEAARRRHLRRELVKVNFVVGQGDFWLVESTFAENGNMLMVVTLMEFFQGQIIREREYSCSSVSAP